MRSGAMRHRLKLQRRSSNRDAGSSVHEYTTVTTIWGRVRWSKPVEHVLSDQVIVSQMLEIESRWDDRIRTDDRLIWQDGTTDRYLRIVGLMDPTGTRQWAKISTVEVPIEERA